MKRPGDTVTEQDFRRPEFVGEKVEDYEFREDGALVRKDRWKRGIYDIVGALNMSSHEFEIPDVVRCVKKLTVRCANNKIDVNVLATSVVSNALTHMEGDYVPYWFCTFCEAELHGDYISPEELEHKEDCPVLVAEKLLKPE